MTNARGLFGLAVGAFIACMIVADYTYFRGFDDGADASTCVIALKVDGPAKAMGERSCKNIKGRRPPPRIFPGTNGDEPLRVSPVPASITAKRRK